MRNRVFGITVFVVLLTLVLVGRLFVFSIINHNYYLAQAENQQLVKNDILPRRGALYAQDGASGKVTTVAQSIESYTLSATPKNVTDKEAYAKLLASLTGYDEAKLLAIFQTPDLSYMNPIARNLDKSQVVEIAAKIRALEKSLYPSTNPVEISFDSVQGNILYYLGGVYFIKGYKRVYPEGNLMGQELGFVDDNGKGRYGLEEQYNNELKGFTGILQLEKDSAGNYLGEDEVVKGQDGNSYELTIDRNIQAKVETLLAERVQATESKGGSVVVLNPKSGEIIAMASTPSYDPNKFRELAQDQIGLFDNPVISKQWEPGSIFKPIVMAGAIDKGVVTPETKDTFAASVTVDSHVINTALNKSFGLETMTDVLANSDNVAMVWLANKMGNQMVSDYVRSFGFGQITGVDLQNEMAGSVLPVEEWRNIHRATISFGQGIAVTPLQVITAYTAIANSDGALSHPHMVKAVIRPDGTREEVTFTKGRSVLKPETAEKLRQMLVAVIVKNHQKAAVAGYKIGGKSGTAQIPNPDGAGYIENAYNHSFVGMGPIDDPKFIILAKLDQPNIEKVGRFAETTASPLFSQVASFLLNYYQIPPTNR